MWEKEVAFLFLMIEDDVGGCSIYSGWFLGKDDVSKCGGKNGLMVANWFCCCK